jgi:hypothetical protein
MLRVFSRYLSRLHREKEICQRFDADFRTLKCRMERPMTAVQTRLMWLEAISEQLRRHIELDGDCRSSESALLSVLLFRAAWDLSNVSDPLMTVSSAHAEASLQTTTS